jgi:beta-galactosidase beta subunit
MIQDNLQNSQSIRSYQISFSQKISNIKNLNITDQTLTDLIFNNEKITVQLITDYMNTNIPEELKL